MVPSGSSTGQLTANWGVRDEAGPLTEVQTEAWLKPPTEGWEGICTSFPTLSQNGARAGRGADKSVYFASLNYRASQTYLLFSILRAYLSWDVLAGGPFLEQPQGAALCGLEQPGL